MPFFSVNKNTNLCCGFAKKKRDFFFRRNEYFFVFCFLRHYLEIQSRQSSIKRGDFGIVNIVQEAPTNFPESEITLTSEQTSDVHDESRKFSILSLVLRSINEQTKTNSAVRRAESIPLSERLSKSKSIPDQARALAQALKQAVVQPIRRSIRRRKTSQNGPQSGQFSVELSMESTDSTSPIPSTPPLPLKPTRQTDESSSASSFEIPSSLSPPAKPPRHFSLYCAEEILAAAEVNEEQQQQQQQQDEDEDENEKDLIQETDELVKKVWNLVESFPSTTKDAIPKELIQFADELAKKILHQCQSRISHQIDASHPSQSIVSMHISPVQRTLRPSMIVSHESSRPIVSPILDIVTSTSTPFVTTSVRVTSPSALRMSSDTTVTILTTKSSRRDSVASSSTITVTTDRNDSENDDNDSDNQHNNNNDDDDDDDEQTSTIYQSADYYPSSTTSPSYVSAASTFNRSGTATPIERRDSQRTENDDLLDLERLSQGRRR